MEQEHVKAEEARHALEAANKRLQHLQDEAKRADSLNNELKELQSRYERVCAEKEKISQALADTEYITNIATANVAALREVCSSINL